MTRLNKIGWLVAFLAIAVLSTAAGEEGIKFGVVDMDQALNSTEEGKAAIEELKRKGREAEAQVKPMIERYEALKEEVRGKKYVLAEEALFERQVELAELENRIKSKYEELNGQMKIDQGRVLAPLNVKMKGVIEEIGKEQGFTMIIQRDNQIIMYSREALDITDLVISRFNKKS